jgi:hypothetical protein
MTNFPPFFKDLTYLRFQFNPERIRDIKYFSCFKMLKFFSQIAIGNREYVYGVIAFPHIYILITYFLFIALNNLNTQLIF